VGGIHPIDPYDLGTHIRYLMHLCYWYVGVFFWFYRQTLPSISGEAFAKQFLDLTPRRKRLLPVLEKQLRELHDDLMKEPTD
jgi:hypothetical protein